MSEKMGLDRRSTSVLLAVLATVRPFSIALLTPLGASRAEKAKVEAFVETSCRDSTDNPVRPGGLVRVTSEDHDPWVALVEVKTGNKKFGKGQVESCLEIAKAEGYDCVLTISNETPPTPDVHPSGISLVSNSAVTLEHVSWTHVLTTAVIEKVHRCIDDPERSGILGELIRYLEHPASGAISFDHMG